MSKRIRKSIITAGFLLLTLVVASSAIAGGNPIKLFFDGQELDSDTKPMMKNNRVLVPIRIIAEALGAEVSWDKGKNTVVIMSPGNKYLNGLNGPKFIESTETPNIHDNFVAASDLLSILDDDKDNDLCDYRDGRSGGDSIANDPLVLDVRGQDDYNKAHIPGSIFIDKAQNMAKPENIVALRKALKAHVEKGGKNIIVAACNTGNTAGLVAGVLGAQGFNIKNLKFGYGIGWEGSKKASAPIYGPREDAEGKSASY